MNFLKSIFNIRTFNYGDEVFKTIIVSSYSKKKLNFMFMTFIATIIRFHIISIICAIFTFNIYIDFFLHILLSILIIINSDIIYNILSKYQLEFYTFTKYYINNFNFENFKKWKKNIILASSIYIILILTQIEITSNLLIIYLIENLIIFLIVEKLENNYIKNIIKNYKEKPKPIIFHNKVEIVENYLLSNSITKTNSNKIKNNKKLFNKKNQEDFIFIEEISPNIINSNLFLKSSK
jgi:hypothetical protein